MYFLLIAFFALAIHLPVIYCCWYVYRAIKDVPQPELPGQGDDYSRKAFEPGPRQRGPEPGGPAAKTLKRQQSSHPDRLIARRTRPSSARR